MATRMNPVVVDTGVTSQDQFALLSEKLQLFLYSRRKPNKKHNCYWASNNVSSQQHEQLKISRKVKSINQSNMTNEEVTLQSV